MQPNTYGIGQSAPGQIAASPAGHVAYGQPHTGQIPTGQPGIVPANPQMQPQTYVPAGSVANQVSEYVEIPGRGAVKLAEMTSRLLARIIDAAVLLVGSGVVYALFALLGAGLGALGGSGSSTEAATVSGGVGGIFGFIVAALVISTVMLTYEIVMVSFWGATVGKMLMKIKVVRIQNGGVPGLFSGFLRWLIPGLCAYIPFIGGFGTLLCYLTPFFDSHGRRQGWHDKVAQTVVVSAR